ncbi:MmgE/PrpD family protein [Halorubrum sp. DTA46]|uniref:MmgE/PrpD family protein n=1 Tax=Halorubrum sp. DTA46 TaxID=3402162 RepID=UPI003AAC80F8
MSNGDDTEPTARLARFVSAVDCGDLDEPVLDATRKALVDTVGACYAGVTTDAGSRMLAYSDTFDGDASTVIGRDQRTIPHIAALANGTTAHALDVDDGHRGASAHPGSPVIPAALALAEPHGADGRQLLTAVVAGYEAVVATAVAVQPSHRERGFHATATAGCFGAAAAASRVLELDETETAHALGLAGTQAGGLFEFLAKGSMSKRFHPGRAAMAGVMAAELAATGFDGPDTILGGEDGFLDAFADAHDRTPFERLGDPFAVTESYLKPYPCCRHIHGPIDAVLAMREEGMTPDDVASIRVETYGLAARHDNASIDNLLDAQMSLPFGVAVALATGDASLDRFDPENAADDDVSRLLDCVTVAETSAMNDLYPETRPATVIVETTAGERLERLVTHPRGAAESPLSTEAVEEKFRDLSKEVLEPEQRESVLDALWDVDACPDVSALGSALGGRGDTVVDVGDE